ncbi:MAG TPA: protein phosphatase 2C domain-containing protein [Blastocatellia bacterium]|nr:protein phosphatase 2C domain-containing protein [Blastocatellia bacterium]
MKVTVGQITDKGLKRQANEDNLLALPSRGLFIVADGVGGRRGGQTASRVVTEVFEKVFSGPQPVANSDLPMEDLRKLVQETIDLCNQKIYTEAELNQELEGMATTIVLAAVRDNRAIIAHVGDSRVYRCDARGLVRLTEDHSEVNEAVRQGWLTPEQAETHPRRNVISRAIGADSDVEPEIIEVQVDETTTLLLCSDGITRHIRDDQLERLLRSGNHPQTVCETFKQLCYNEGAEDNLTAIIVDFGERGYVDEQTRPMRSMSPSMSMASGVSADAEKPRKKIEISLHESEPEFEPVAESDAHEANLLPMAASPALLPPAPDEFQDEVETSASSEPLPIANHAQASSGKKVFNIGPADDAGQKVEMSKFMRMSVLIVTLLAGFILGGLFGGPLQRVVNRAGGPLAEEQPRVLRYSPRDAGVASAFALLNEGRIEDARQELNQILARDANNAEAHYCFGRLYFTEKKYEEAINHFKLAATNNQDLDEGWVFIAMAYLQIGQARNAADSLQKLMTPTAPPSSSPMPASPAPAGSVKPVG